MNQTLQITHATATPYCLPLRQGWQSAAGYITERCGWIITITTANNYTGLGDAAPLPEAGTETPFNTIAILNELLPKLINQSIDFGLKLLHTPQYQATPCAYFGIETALLNILASTNNLQLIPWFNRTTKNNIPVNAAVGTIDKHLTTRIQTAIAMGYTVLKIKVGLHSWTHELQCLNQIVKNLTPEIKLRLDANQAWNKPQATAMLQQLINLPIESVEEPLANADFYELTALQKQVPFAIAIDESVPKLLPQLFITNPCPTRRIIIKPAVIGGLYRTYELITRAEQNNIEWVITSTLESSIGIRAIAHLAAALNANLAQGLATATWFTHDLIPPLPIRNGVMYLND